MIVKQNEKGEQVGEPYISVRQAAKEMGVDHTSILRAIDKHSCSCKGYKWVTYVEPITSGNVSVSGITPKEFHDFEADILPYLKNIGERAKEKNSIQQA